MCFKKGRKEIKYKNNGTLSQLFEQYEEEVYNSAETEKSRETIKKATQLQDKFYKSLNREQQQEFDKIDKLQLDYNYEIEKGIFVYGYKLAINMIIESIKK